MRAPTSDSPPIFWVYATGFPKAYNVANGIEGKLTLGTADWSEWKRLEGEKLLNDFGFSKRQFEQGSRGWVMRVFLPHLLKMQGSLSKRMGMWTLTVGSREPCLRG